MMNLVMKLAPIGAGAAMAFTFGAYGVDALWPLARLMVGYYLTCLVFVGSVLGLIAAWCGRHRPVHPVHQGQSVDGPGTSSSESALVPLMHKLESLGQ